MIHNDKEKVWIQTYTGKKFYPFNPEESEIDIEDIGHALSMMCRYNGHCNQFYSVAQHSVYVSQMVDNKYKLAALLHDASEAYIADITRPVKPYLINYKEIESRISNAIFKHFEVEYSKDVHDKVKWADDTILMNEKRDIMKDISTMWTVEGEPYPGLIIKPVGPNLAKELFLREFNTTITRNKILPKCNC